MGISIFDSDGNLTLALRQLRLWEARRPESEIKEPPDNEAFENTVTAMSVVRKKHPEIVRMQVTLHGPRVMFYFVYKHKSTQALIPNDMVRTTTSAMNVLEKIIKEQVDYYECDRYGK